MADAKLVFTMTHQLQDIFTIHPDTGCHTHDLLECPCEGSRGLIEAVEDDEAEVEDLDASDPPKGFVPASQVLPGQIEKHDQAVCGW